jgi:recombination protein RecA
MAPPFKQAEFDILFGTGISREGSLLDFGVEHNIVRKSGAWYTYDGDQLGQGKENSRKYLIERPAMADEIELKILTALGIGDAAPEADAVPEQLAATGTDGAMVDAIAPKIAARKSDSDAPAAPASE